MALSALVRRQSQLGHQAEFGVLANAVIFQGAAIGLSAGYARPLTAGDPFIGFALETVTGSAANGGKTVAVETEGNYKLTITSVAITDVGKAVYASDDGTFTLTQGSNSRIGTVYAYDSANTAWVAFETVDKFTTGIATLGIGSLTFTPVAGSVTLIGSTFGTTVASDINQNFGEVWTAINAINKALK